VKAPADVGGQLLGFRAGQHHAEIERVQEAAFINPTPLVHQQAVHQRNLTRWAAKAQ
jgi:hypothetical protein